jgi:hypothetical protein
MREGKEPFGDFRSLGSRGSKTSAFSSRNQNGISKTNAMFTEVGVSFAGIPFVIHQPDYEQICTTARGRCEFEPVGEREVGAVKEY